MALCPSVRVDVDHVVVQREDFAITWSWSMDARMPMTLLYRFVVDCVGHCRVFVALEPSDDVGESHVGLPVEVDELTNEAGVRSYPSGVSWSIDAYEMTS